MKNVKGNISAAVRPTLMKFGTMMHVSAPNLIGNQKLKNSKIQDVGRKIVLSHKPLADFDKILHNDTYYSPRAYQLIKKSNFKNKTFNYTVSQKTTLMLHTITSMHINRFWYNFWQRYC